jgi:DNA-binding transcriptional ArsR family regulator
MEKSLSESVEIIEKTMWGQWAALGAYVTVEACRRCVVDPEALLVATCTLGRSDIRLFDEALDWLVINHELLRPSRLTRTAREFGPEAQRILGAAAEFISERTGSNLLPGVKKAAQASIAGAEEEYLFPSARNRKPIKGRERQKAFLEWGLLRGEPRIREHSGTPDLENPANIMIRMRMLYGASSRAEILTYLFAGQPGNSHEIARRIKYDQAGVYRELEKLVKAGMVSKHKNNRDANYWIDRNKFAESLAIEGEWPVFLVWGDVYRAYYLVLKDIQEHPEEYDDRFLAAERMRELTPEVVSLLRNSGEPLSQLPVPDIERQKGAEHQEKLLQYMGSAAEKLSVSL